MTPREPGTTTWSVTELHAALNEAIEYRFGAKVWVVGELRSLKRTAAGHCYFDLVDASDADGTGPLDTGRAASDQSLPRLSVTLFNGYRRRVNAVLTKARAGVAIEEGTTLRISGELKTYEARSQLQLMMTGIDPSFTLGVMQQRRDRALAALAADGLLDRNASLALAHPPLRLALVTSRGSAAEADVLDELRRSGIGFEVSVLDARVQGLQAEETIAAALRTAAALAVDAVLLVRGGGARTDLEAFDGEQLGRAIASMPVPVLTGIGHETDRTVADEVAHTAFKTPTACAAALVDDARRALLQVMGHAASVGVASRGRLARASGELGRLSRATGVACRGHVRREQDALEGRAERVARAAPAAIQRRADRLDAGVGDLRRTAQRSLDDAARRLEHHAALVSAHDPALVLARGWSLTRTADGTLVRSATTVSAGTPLVTTLADGDVHSTVVDPAAAQEALHMSESPHE